MLAFRILGILAALGCGTTSLSGKGRQIAVSEDPGPECVELGAVSGSADPFFGALKADDQLAEAARNDALNRAAEMGATHVKFTGSPTKWPSGTFGGGNAMTVDGVAYRCGKPGTAASAPASSAGCSKDTDCKGDRICESGKCVDPAPRGSTR
jgi:hypothetical protein